MKRTTSLAYLIAGLAGCSATGAPPDATLAHLRIEQGPMLSAPRATHASVRSAGGYLLAIGGCVRSGCQAGPASATVDIISPDASRVLREGALLERRVTPFAVALADGSVLIGGGWVGSKVSATTEIFDPSTGRSREGPRMAGPRSQPSVIALRDGRILVAGGHDGRGLRGDAEIFDPDRGEFTATGNMRVPRSGATATLLPDGKVLLVAGGNPVAAGGRHALASAEIFDPRTGRFELTGSLSQRRYKHAAVALEDGSVLVIGGSGERDYSGKLDSVERYDVASGRFSPAGRLASPRFKLTDGVILVAPGKVLVAAGDESPELFDVATGTGTMLSASLDGEWNYMTLVEAGEQTALLAGGYLEGRIEPTNRSWVIRY